MCRSSQAAVCEEGGSQRCCEVVLRRVGVKTKLFHAIIDID